VAAIAVVAGVGYVTAERDSSRSSLRQNSREVNG
jgi:hypothetical protein